MCIEICCIFEPLCSLLQKKADFGWTKGKWAVIGARNISLFKGWVRCFKVTLQNHALKKFPLACRPGTKMSILIPLLDSPKQAFKCIQD